MPILESPYKNQILRRLSPEALHRLQLTRIELPLHYCVEAPQQPVNRLIFLEAGVASMVPRLENGCCPEALCFGFNSVAGVAALAGAPYSLNRLFMRVGGFGYCAPLSTALDEFQRSLRFQRLILRALQGQLTQALQTAACNSSHPLEQRLACRLLLYADHVPDPETPMVLFHEHLSEMLGSTRSTVTIAAGKLQTAGILRYSRGRIHILNRPALEQRSCACYRTIARYLSMPGSRPDHRHEHRPDYRLENRLKFRPSLRMRQPLNPRIRPFADI